MYFWRISKYNPIYRNKEGIYLKNEWTSFSDIGKTFDGEILTLEEYLKIEKNYTNTVILFMDELGISSLKVIQLEKYKNISEISTNAREMDMVFNNIKEGKMINISDVKQVVKLILREYIWCKLESDDMFVHFGYDYYMYIGSKFKITNLLEKIKALGLFVEPMNSPYID